MNQRIKELREQASDFAEVAWAKQTQATWKTNKDIHTIYDEKFAELIVRECAKCMTTPQIQAKLPDDVVMKTVLDVLVSDMKQHFGVEE
jgi:hypothetical protein